VPANAAPAPLYLSRRDSPKRAMDNEEALCRALEARGLETVVMSGLPFAAQIARIRRAPLIVAAHGAGLAHLLTARPGTRVLEVVPVLPGSLMMRCCFAKLSWLFGHEHHLWLENANPLTGRWAADVPRIMDLLDGLDPTRTGA
jgi:capsular polysaccharide biosynthesis protein